MSEPLKILFVDDHALMRDSLSRLLDAEPDIQVVGAVGDAGEAIAQLDQLAPDIVLMDIDMPGLNSFEAASQIKARKPRTRIIFLSGFFHDRYIQQALEVKAEGYLIKSEPPAQVIQAIHQVAQGKIFFSEDVRSRIVVGPSGPSLASPGQRTRVSTLTDREREVLHYLAQGLAKKEIANVMGLSIKTIEGHVEKIMNKLDIHDRVELTRFAIREGLMEA